MFSYNLHVYTQYDVIKINARINMCIINILILSTCSSFMCINVITIDNAVWCLLCVLAGGE